MKAVANVNDIIAPAIVEKEMDPVDQASKPFGLNFAARFGVGKIIERWGLLSTGDSVLASHTEAPGSNQAFLHKFFRGYYTT